jgi:hypothetical protein
MLSLSSDAARRGERGGREGSGEGEASGDTVDGGEREELASGSSAVATGASRPLALEGLLSRREDTVAARGRLLVRGRRDKEGVLATLMLLPRESVR